VQGKLALVATISVFTFGLGASAAVAVEWVAIPPEVKPAPWGNAYQRPYLRPVSNQSFRLAIDGGFCAGEGPPKIDHVRVVERPKTRSRPFKSAVVTVFKYRPEHFEGRQTEEEIREGKKFTLCADIGGELRDVVKLKRPLDHLILYDGNYSPPKRVWPPY